MNYKTQLKLPATLESQESHSEWVFPNSLINILSIFFVSQFESLVLIVHCHYFRCDIKFKSKIKINPQSQIQRDTQLKFYRSLKAFSFVTKSTKQALYDIYRRDFELFGYDAEQYFLWTGFQNAISWPKSLHGHKNNSVKKRNFETVKAWGAPEKDLIKS